MPKPVRMKDVEAALNEFNSLCTFHMQGGEVAVQLKSFIDTSTFKQVLDKVKALGGRYVQGKRLFLVPVEAEELSPFTPPHEEAEEGVNVTFQPSHEGSKPEFQTVPVNAVVSMPFQSRLEFDEEALDELAASIRVHGVLEPLLVRPEPSGLYGLVCGERRLRASKKAGLTMVPCIVRQLPDREAFEAHLIENDQRRDLTDYERGRMYSEMLRRFPEAYPNQKALADKIGRSQQYVSYLIAHYDAVEELKRKAVIDTESEITTRVVKLPERVTREIRQAPAEAQAKIVEAAVKEELSAREVRDLVDVVKGIGEEELDTVLQKQAEKEKKKEEKEPIDWTKPIIQKFCPVCNQKVTDRLFDVIKEKWGHVKELFKE